MWKTLLLSFTALWLWIIGQERVYQRFSSNKKLKTQNEKVAIPMKKIEIIGNVTLC